MSGRSGRDFRSSVGHHQDAKGEGAGGRHGPERSQHNPARARNRSETRSEGSEYEEIPTRRRERGSETGSESGTSDLGPSDREDHPKPTKNGPENSATTLSAPPRANQTRVFTPRGVPSRRGRGGSSSGANMYRGSGNMGGPVGGHRTGPIAASHGGPNKSSTGRRQQHQNPGPKDSGRGANVEKKERASDGGPHVGLGPQTQSLPSSGTAPATTENGGLITQVSNSTHSTGGPNALPLPNRGFPPSGFERPPRRRRHGRSQHQQDKPPRFRRLKERENAARINGGVGVIGTGRPSSPSVNAVTTETNGATVPPSGNAPNSNHNPLNTNNHHHHYSQGNSGSSHGPHHHGAKSPDFTNQNSDQANEEWETASESSDFTEFRERDAGGKFNPHGHHPGRVGPTISDLSKEPASNKRSFSSQRPGMERQNRRVNPGATGGKGPRMPPGGGPGPNSGGRGEKRGNWPSPKNRK